jgi:ABC-type multidrug transport system ATPase subunit
MEEADHLFTRIGIMNFGRLRCLGTQNRLKSKFGTGYQLAFNWRFLILGAVGRSKVNLNPFVTKYIIDDNNGENRMRRPGMYSVHVSQCIKRRY